MCNQVACEKHKYQCDETRIVLAGEQAIIKHLQSELTLRDTTIKRLENELVDNIRTINELRMKASV